MLALAGSKQANGIPGVESERKVLALSDSKEAKGIPKIDSGGKDLKKKGS